MVTNTRQVYSGIACIKAWVEDSKAQASGVGPCANVIQAHSIIESELFGGLPGVGNEAGDSPEVEIGVVVEVLLRVRTDVSEKEVCEVVTTRT
jgi:hypothetical protein